MSFLDKLNDTLIESNDTDNLYKTQIEELKTDLKHANDINNKNLQEINRLKALLDNKSNSKQKDLEVELSNANEVNNKNIQEINELKNLINEYKNQIINLKQSYDDSLEDLKSQLNFEKEINQQYLSKIIESNKDINTGIKNLKDKTVEVKEDSVNSSNSKEDMNCLKELINNYNKQLVDLISDVKEDQINESNKIIEQIAHQNNNLSNIENNNEKLDTLGDLIQNNYQQVSDLINQNNEEQCNVTKKIIDEINGQSQDIQVNVPEDELNQIKELISNNKDEINKLNDKTSTIDENILDDLLNKINDSIKCNNEELINHIDKNRNNTKVEIFNKISDDLKNENYVNLLAYKKIKEMNLFDEAYYKSEYDYNLDIDPLLHFIYKGYEENKSPREDFNPSEYKNSNKSILESNLNPLVYFVTKGINEGNVKINDDLDDLKHVNKYELDKKIDSFSQRGVRKSKRKPRIIVSLTSIPERIPEVQYTLYSLLNQELKPDKVMLWLSKDQFPNGEIDLPKEVLKLKQNGLSLRFSDDYRSFTKIIPTLKSYPNDIIVTADDDIYYPSNWLKILYDTYKKNEDMIICQKARRISFDNEGNVDDYNSWKTCQDFNGSYLNFISGEGGVLYPPKSLHEDAVNEELFLDLCKYSDNLWLWAMAVLNNKKIKIAKNKSDNSLIYVNPAREYNLTNEFVLSDKNISDDCANIQIKNVFEKYPEILDIIKND